MTREIKFCVWDNKNKKIYYPECYSTIDEDLTIYVEGDVFWSDLVEEDEQLEVVGNIHENPELLQE